MTELLLAIVAAAAGAIAREVLLALDRRARRTGERRTRSEDVSAD